MLTTKSLMVKKGKLHHSSALASKIQIKIAKIAKSRFQPTSSIQKSSETLEICALTV